MKKEIWIGLVEVISQRENDVLALNEGAFVNVLTKADSEKEYSRKVKTMFQHYNIKVKNIEEIEILAERMKRQDIEESLLQIAERIKSNNHVIFGTFHTYKLNRS